MRIDQNSTSLIALGEIIKPHGLNGELKFNLYNPSSANLAVGKMVQLTGKNIPKMEFEIEGISDSSLPMRVFFKGISSKSDAERLRGALISVPRDELPELESGEYYLFDLIGFNILDEKKDSIGNVKDVTSLPASNVLVTDYNNKEVLIPLVDDFIQLIDFENRTIIIHVMEGLLDQ